MSRMVFLAHLPMLRIAEEEVAFGGGSLWRLPFEVYNNLSAGAFSDHEKAYNETAPVFYRVDADIATPLARPAEEPPKQVAEIKAPSNNWGFIARFGMDFILRFQGNLVERARAALLLAAPACSLPESVLSVTFVRLTEQAGFQVGDLFADTIRVQGDADQEYLFLPATAGVPLSTEVIREAEKILATVNALAEQPELLAATRALLRATAPMLSAESQLVLCVRAIEALLLPETTRGLGRTFASRLSRLLAVDEEHLKALEGVARTLYDARSASLHGEEARSPEAAQTAAAEAHAEQLLAAAILRMAERSKAISVAEQRQALDQAAPEFKSGAKVLPEANPPGRRSRERMLRLKSPIVATFSSGADMGCKDGTLSWSPLIGLALAMPGEAFPLKKGPDGVAILPLSGEEMVSLEERDIARDFISQLRVESEPAAVLLTGARGEKPEPTPQNLSAFLRRRDLATTALRLAGFGAFYDPELLGVFVYQDSIRTRFPSVFRQTIEQKMRNEPKERMNEADIERVARFLELLSEYDGMARHEQIDDVLGLFRHAFHQEFLPEISRASLLLSAVEAMLGRFRKPKELEGLVAGLIRPEFPDAAKWFEERGRGFRNSIAHGTWPDAKLDPDPMEKLVEVARGLIPQFVRAWLARSNREAWSPLRAFLESAPAKGDL